MRAAVVVLLTASLLAPGVAQAKEKPLGSGVHHLESPKHDRPFSLVVPSKYSKKKTWPLVISSHGRGGSGKGEMRPWQALANKHGFLVACPDMVTATHNRPPTSNLPGWQEDDEVVLSIIDFVKARFNVNHRAVMITGFSGGGNPSYHTGLGHPEVFTHICTRGGNFSPQQVPRDDEVLAAGRKHLQIYIFYGDKDHPLILGADGKPGAAVLAHDALKEAGYENLVIEKVANMKHQSRPEKAAAWFADWVGARAKQFKYAADADKLMRKAADSAAHPAKAIKLLQKALTLQKKAGFDEAAQVELDQLEAKGQARIVEAQALHEAGQTAEGVKILKAVSSAFKGLQAAKDAAALVKSWK